MDSCSSCTVALLLCVGAIILQVHFGNSKELHQEVACYRDRLRIDCGDHSFIAIHEAFFTTHVKENTTCGPAAIENEDPDQAATDDPAETPGCGEDIRLSINKRCSGSKKCTYSYHDLADKKCPNIRGQYVVRYDCVRNNSVVNYCNTRLLNREGYFSSPGFPQYYPQLTSCAWTISAARGQTILLKVLHLHLRPATEVFPTVSDPDSLYAMSILGGLTAETDARCDMDSLTIMEEGSRRESLCGESLESLKEIELETGEAEINFRSLTFMPASGFLVYYKIQGCPTPANAGDSRLMEGNSSIAVYVCEDEKVFNDTLESERFLSCVRDHHWNDTLPPCISLVDTTKPSVLISAESAEADMENITLSSANNTLLAESSNFSSSFVEDVVVPSVLIGVLLLGNVFIVITILIMRKRQRSKALEEEELGDPKSDPLISEIKEV